jgi:hypothetical protein
MKASPPTPGTYVGYVTSRTPRNPRDHYVAMTPLNLRLLRVREDAGG